MTVRHEKPEDGSMLIISPEEEIIINRDIGTMVGNDDVSDSPDGIDYHAIVTLIYALATIAADMVDHKPLKGCSVEDNEEVVVSLIYDSLDPIIKELFPDASVHSRKEVDKLERVAALNSDYYDENRKVIEYISKHAAQSGHTKESADALQSLYYQGQVVHEIVKIATDTD